MHIFGHIYRRGRWGGLVILWGVMAAATAASEPAPQAQLAHAYDHLPLRFEANQGQTAPQVRFLAHGPGYRLFLTAKEAVLVLQKPAATADSRKAKTTGTVLHMQLVGANLKAPITGQAPLPGKVNYLWGNDPKQWRTNIPTYAHVKYNHIYPGIDLIYYGRQHQLEYDFIIKPGADPQAIHLAFKGAESVRFDESQLVLATSAGEVALHKPRVYQEIGGEKHVIRGGYVRQGPHQVGFRVGSYNPAYPLVIDPLLSYATHLGRSGSDYGTAIAVDSHGQAYVTGSISSINFPTHEGLQSAYNGDTYYSPGDAFVVKFNRAGNALVYATYLGGRGEEFGYGIAVDSRGQAYVTGETQSSDFPLRNALQPTLSGRSDAFVAKLNRAGDALAYSTYLGGRDYDLGKGITVDSRSQAYVMGVTESGDFPLRNALQPTFGGMVDAFVTKLSRTGDVLVYSTYLGGSDCDFGTGIAIGTFGQVYMTGGVASDAFVAEFTATGDALVYSNHRSRRGDNFGEGIVVDSRGQAYVIGITSSYDFPITPNSLQPILGGSYDAFVAKLTAMGDALVYSTYLGGSNYDEGTGIVVGPRGQAYVIGNTYSDDFPTQNPLQPTSDDEKEVIVAKFSLPRSSSSNSEHAQRREMERKKLTIKSSGRISSAPARLF